MVQKLLTQGKVLTQMFRGSLIMVEHLKKPEPKTVYRLTSNQKVVHQSLFDMLIAEKLIKPNNDGLFADQSQTYSIVRSSDPQ